MNAREWRPSSGYICRSSRSPGDSGIEPFSFLNLVAPELRSASAPSALGDHPGATCHPMAPGRANELCMQSPGSGCTQAAPPLGDSRGQEPPTGRWDTVASLRHRPRSFKTRAQVGCEATCPTSHRTNHWVFFPPASRPSKFGGPGLSGALWTHAASPERLCALE